MRRNILLPSTMLTIAILAVSLLTPTSASNETVKQILSPSMNGLAFASTCCPDVSTNLSGFIITDNNGIIELVQQKGTLTIGTTNYNLQFNPTSNLEVQTFTNSCSSGTTYNQEGEIVLNGNDGTIIKGTGKFAWGSSPDCSGGTYTFTNFSGQIKDPGNQTTNFYTGSGLLPVFH